MGIAKAALFPTIAAVALASTWRNGPPHWPRVPSANDRSLFQPTLNLSYLIFDFGGRNGAVTEARDNLFAADFAFNDTPPQDYLPGHSDLLSIAERNRPNWIAARATLANAQTVQQDAEARASRNGVATLPDVLEARSAAAQADYDLQAAIGVQETALGDLSTTLGLPANQCIPGSGGQ